MDLRILNMHISARNPNRKNAHKGGSGSLMSGEYSYTIETSPHFVVYMPTSGTNTQHKFMKGTLMKDQTQETLEMFPQQKYQITNSLPQGFLASLLALLENEEDSRILEELCSLKLLESPKRNDLSICSLRM